MVYLRGIKTFLFTIIVLVVILGIVLISFSLFIFLFPVIVVLGIIGYFLRKLRNKKKEEPQKKDYLDIEYKVKEWSP